MVYDEIGKSWDAFYRRKTWPLLTRPKNGGRRRRNELPAEGRLRIRAAKAGGLQKPIKGANFTYVNYTLVTKKSNIICTLPEIACMFVGFWPTRDPRGRFDRPKAEKAVERRRKKTLRARWPERFRPKKEGGQFPR
jgi:hypothetical protein